MQFNWDLTPDTEINWKHVKDLNFILETLKLKRKLEGKALSHWSWQWFHGYDTKSTGNKNKISETTLS